jgi:hypothetical protein
MNRPKRFRPSTKICGRKHSLLPLGTIAHAARNDFRLLSAPPQSGAAQAKEGWKASKQMPMRSGRLEKRTPLAIPVRVSSSREPSVIERTTTENVSSSGIRVVLSQRRQLNEPMFVNSSDGGLETQARVVYCQPLSDGHFAIGLRFPQDTSGWLKKKLNFGD